MVTGTAEIHTPLVFQGCFQGRGNIRIKPVRAGIHEVSIIAHLPGILLHIVFCPALCCRRFRIKTVADCRQQVLPGLDKGGGLWLRAVGNDLVGIGSRHPVAAGIGE